MNKFLILCFAAAVSCTSATSQKYEDMQSGDMIISESQGGSEKAGFAVIKNKQEFLNLLGKNSGLTEVGTDPSVNYPDFPENKKAVVYYLGTFSSGDHRIKEIKSISVKNNILYVEVPYYESGGMEIQVISRPWFVFTVPSAYQFNSVELKYSK